MKYVKSILAIAACVLVWSFVPGCPRPPVATLQEGHVRSGNTPIRRATVTLYRAGDQKGSGEVALGSAVTDASGFFRIPYTPQDDPAAVLYLVAHGPLATTRLATVLGTAPVSTSVTINERTTVATAYAMAQFIVENRIGGHAPGLQNAAGTFRNLVNVTTGRVGEVLGSAPNGSVTSTMPTFNSLANMLAGCFNSPAASAALFVLATPPNGTAPDNTLQAAINIAHFSWQNNTQLFLTSTIRAPYQPALAAAPETWSLAIKYIGNGHEFDGPTNIAFDAFGNAWVGNNYVFREDHSLPSCGSKLVSKLTPTGFDAPGAPFDGTDYGVDGAGFGTTLDPSGNVWIGSFGFYGTTCPESQRPGMNTVSKFSPDGTPLCPPGGFMQACIRSPQGTVSDAIGNIWIANLCGGTVTQYIGGDPNNAWVLDVEAGTLADPNACPALASAQPFGVAIDVNGNAWVSDNGRDTAFQIGPDGALIGMADPQAPFSRPLGIAIDSVGNVWVSNSGVINPCLAQNQAYMDDVVASPPNFGFVTKLHSDGSFVGRYNGGGVSLPWGIAVDGDDNIWVANFNGQRVTALDGATGQPIAPNGYPSDGLVRNTGVTIDSSGNVWLCNNWLLNPVQTNPGGDGLVVFIGLAAPVKTPLIGPPRQP